MAQAKRRLALMDVLDRVLDKGIVIDAGIRVSVIGIDLLGVDAKITVASIETYLELAADPRAYGLGLIGGAPLHGTPEALERLTGPRELPEKAGEKEGTATHGGGAAPPPERELPLVAHHEEDLPQSDGEPEG